MDGGSDDGSVGLLEAHSSPSLRWWSEPDSGQSEAINKAFRESRGEIIGWLNSDDAYFAPDVVESAVQIFAARPEVMVVYGHAALVNADGLIIQLIWAPAVLVQTPPPARLHLPARRVRPTFGRRRPARGRDIRVCDGLRAMAQAGARGLARLDRILAIDRHHPDRKSYTWLEASNRDHAVLRQRFGIAPQSGASEVARRAVKVGLRFAGASQVRAIERQYEPLGWRLDSRRRLLRRQIMVRRAAMPLGTASDRGCLARDVAERALPAAPRRCVHRRHHAGVPLARCGHCEHGRKLSSGTESALAIAVDVEDREPSTPATGFSNSSRRSITTADRLDVLDVGCWNGDLLSGLPARLATTRAGTKPGGGRPSALGRTRRRHVVGRRLASRAQQLRPRSHARRPRTHGRSADRRDESPRTAPARRNLTALTGDGGLPRGPPLR